ncbi:8467_t:CDS:2 [Gigaspora margarita]|uniref:8467_t:CDS:1 n=1 Tax=Gigaspora margarita TaxID=4874 RepID=A0ABN7VG91_GIGMA|nr:8467_t:CDS:2 [Gigaspora margarita]
MESKTEFDEVDLCFASNIESNNLPDSEAEADLTDSEEGLYPLTKEQSFAD